MYSTKSIPDDVSPGETSSDEDNGLFVEYENHGSFSESTDRKAG